jgi:Transglycosylase-like domain
LPDSAGRRRAVSVAILAAVLIVSIVPSAATSTTAPPGLARFLYALGEIESGGNYTARNSVTGAYGKYQIMPSNWPTWARIYIGSSTAPQTPSNQERVARGKVTSLYNWLDTWPNVAHWWLTGSGERNQALWSSYSRYYVNKLMAIYKATATAPAVGSTGTTTAATVIHVGQSASAIAYAGPWPIARFGGYTGGKVKYSVRDGATATFTFTGRSVAWVGPLGPTRGRARVFVDGVAVGIVNLRRSSFQARATLFRKAWATAGAHTLTIKVIGSGRPVAIDEFLIRR